jgi:hypothetical protein
MEVIEPGVMVAARLRGREAARQQVAEEVADRLPVRGDN